LPATASPTRRRFLAEIGRICESGRTNLPSRFNVICPVQSLPRKYSCFRRTQIRARNPAVPFLTRGVGHRHERWDGMRWTRQRRRAMESQGRFKPVSGRQRARRTALNPPSLKLRRTGTKPVEAFGAGGCVRQNRVVLAPVAGVKSAEVFVSPTGRDKAANPSMTVTRGIRRRGERGISRKTIAQGRRNAPTVPVCSCAFSFVHVAHETAGAARTRRSLRPLLDGRNDLQSPGETRHGNAEVCFVSWRAPNHSVVVARQKREARLGLK
jgi:hypothetical protein